jgi:cytochrome c-type biogenesis protein CcsB
MSFLFLWVALGLYALGIALTVPSVARRRPAIPRPAMGAFGFGVLSNALALGVETVELHRLPLIDVRSAMSFFAFLATLAFLFAYWRYRITALGLFVQPLAFVFTLISVVRPERPFTDPAFRGGWLLIHISSIFLGYTAFLLTFVAALMYLIQTRELKSKKPRAFYYRLPSLEICDEIYSRSLLIGLPFLTLGILMGFIAASRAWKGPWEFDPKILASMVTWLIYLVLFSTRLSGAWRGRRSAYLAVLGFAVMMVTLFGISFLSGQHGFKPEFGPLP